MSPISDERPGFLEQTQAMQRFLPYLRGLVGDAAVVTPEDYWASEPDGTVDRDRGPSIRSVFVEPHNSAALPFDIICEQCIVVELGEIGGRWELDYEPTGFDHAERLAEAAVAGRVVETFALGRSRVDVTFADGSTDSATGYQGCLTSLVVLPGWTKWGRVATYEPYHAR